MHFCLPRRRRRRLLLPPGWVALAGLLLLGCLALRPWQEQLMRRSVIQLTMPTQPQLQQKGPSIRWYVPDPDTLRSQYPWRQTELTGNQEQDDRQPKRLIQALHSMAADTLHGGVLCVPLGPKTRYANLVSLLDLMLREKVTHYWLDVTRRPTTFYAFQPAYNSHQQAPVLSCGTSYQNTRLQPVKPSSFGVRFDEWVIDFWQFQWLRQLGPPEWLALLQNTAWRIPLALLSLLFLLSLRHLWATHA